MTTAQVDPVLAAPIDRPQAAGSWRSLAVALLFAVLLAGLYSGILRDLAWQWWEDPNYSHGFLVPLFSAFIAWQRREELREAAGEGSWWGLALLLCGLAGLALGELGAENFLGRSSLIIVLAGLVWLHAGWPVLRLLAFPLGFLFFMVPLPDTVFYALMFPLQRLAAENAGRVLDLLGVPVLMDGNVIHLSDVTLGVTEACSGIRSLISLLALAVAWAYFTLPGVVGILLAAIASVPITIVANAARIVLTGLIAQWFGMEYAEGFFHTFSGWVVFVLAFLCLLALRGVIAFASSRIRRRQ